MKRLGGTIGNRTLDKEIVVLGVMCCQVFEITTEKPLH